MIFEELIHNLIDTWIRLETDLLKSVNGNKTAAQRARVASIYFAKMLKDFRKQSVKL